MIDFQQIATLRRLEPSQRFPDYFNSTNYQLIKTVMIKKHFFN